MRRERAGTDRILAVEVHENGGVVRREVPGGRGGADVVDVAGEIDLRKEPLDFKNIF